MQDLSSKVQCIADAFFKDHRNLNNFNKFYNVMQPEANRMLRAYLKDRSEVQDVSSKIFESILLKPPIYHTDIITQEFLEMATFFHNVPTKHYIYNIPSKDDPSKSKTKAYYAPIDKTDGTTGLSFAEVGKLWSIINRADEYRVIVLGKVILVIDYLELNTVVVTATNSKQPEVRARRIHELFKKIDRIKLANCPSPFIFDPTKPFLHYFSRVIKTNALSLLKKNGKYQEITESEQYCNYNDDDRSQLLNNQLSDEKCKSDEMDKEMMRKLFDQKCHIIYDVIQNHYFHEDDAELKEAMVQAILFDKDYQKICEEHNWHVENGTNAGKKATGKIKSRVHRFRKILNIETAKTPQFTKGTSINIDLFQTYYSDGAPHIVIEIIEVETEPGIFQTLWHGDYIRYYSTGEVKEMGRFYLGEKQDIWYEYYKTGEVMKRGKYQIGKQIGKWHHFNDEGEVTETSGYQGGVKTYYEVRNRIDKWHCNIIAGNPDNPIVTKLKRSEDEITAEKLCLKYDDQLAYSPIHLQISEA